MTPAPMPSTLNRHLRSLATCLTVGLATAGSSVAQSQEALHTGHAIPGFYGFESSVRPPTGMSYDNLLHLYNAETELDRDGNDTGTSGSVRHLSNHFTATWTSPWKIFGGLYAARATISIGNSAPHARSLDSGNRGFKFGDTYFEPLALYWPGEKGFASFRAGWWLDTGDFEAGNNNSSGKGFQTRQMSFGFTYYPYEDRLWHTSALIRWGQHTKVDGLDLRPGDDIVLDWSFGKHLTDRWNAGMVGYGVWQTSRDKGADANEDIGFYGTSALGLGARYEMPSWGGFAELRVYQELNSFNHTEGQAVAFQANFLL